MGDNIGRGSEPDFIHRYSSPALVIEHFLLISQLVICSVQVNLEVVVNCGKSPPDFFRVVM